MALNGRWALAACSTAFPSEVEGASNYREATQICRDELQPAALPGFVAGASIAGAGLITMGINARIPAHPVKENERKRLGDEYNRALIEELGLDEE